jgi:Tfp pilus assembly protein PilF
MRTVYLSSISVMAALAAVAGAVGAQSMPSQKEIDEAMRQMQRQIEKLTPEQRKMIEQAQRQMLAQPDFGSDDDIVVPKRDAGRIAKISGAPLTGAQLKAHVEALQPKIASALTPVARDRAQRVETELRKSPDVAARTQAAAHGLAAWGAWPEATYLMGKAALASGSAQDLNNLAAFLTMQRASQAAVPILLTLNARYPNNSTVLNNLGQAWFELGDMKEAEKYLTLAIRRSPNHPQANVTQSRIEEARGDKQVAQASMRRAIAGGYGEAKEQRLARLGGKLQKGDVRWTLKVPADALALGKFVPPPYALKIPDLWLLPPAWHSFRATVESERDKYKAQANALAKQSPWLADATFRGPLTAKAARVTQLNGDEWKQRRQAAHGAYMDAIRFEQQERKALEGNLAAIHAEGQQKYRNVAGGYQYDYACPQIRAAIAQYLEASGTRLEQARRGLLDYERQATNDRLYYAQFMQSQRSFEYTVTQGKVEFLNVLLSSALNSGPGLMHQYGNSCLKPEAARKAGGPLADFDDIHCEHLVDFTVPGIGSIKVRCNRMETTLEPFASPIKVKWEEDLNKDRVLNASAQIDVQGARVGGRGEFDDSGLKGGGAFAGIGESAGPVDAQAGVQIEFDRSGVTDIRATAEVSVGDSASVSWSSGASAGASGNFNSKGF